MGKLTIFFDIDGVIGDLLTPWLTQYNNDYHDDLTPEDIRGWAMHPFVVPECGKKIYDYMYQEGFWIRPTPYPGAVEALKEIQKDGHHIYLATTPVASKLCHWEKQTWVHTFLPFIGSSRLIFIHDKSVLKGDILVEDNAENAASFHPMSILMDRPWNRDEESQRLLSNIPYVTRAFGWKDIMQLIRYIYDKGTTTGFWKQWHDWQQVTAAVSHPVGAHAGYPGSRQPATSPG